MSIRTTVSRWLNLKIDQVPLGLSRRTITSSELPYSLHTTSLEEIASGFGSILLSIPGSQIARTRSMVLPLTDLLSVTAICAARLPKRVFEIGTFTGSTTLLMALNTSDDTKLFTLDLEPREFPKSLLNSDGKPMYEAGSLFHEEPIAAKITQLYGRSDCFDFSSYFGTIDLVYIDAEHSREAVLRDSENAMKMLSLGGMIIWDDYRWLPEHSECIGVTHALNELSEKWNIRQLSNTRLAIFVNES